MGLSQELAYQPVAKKSLPPKPKKNQADMKLELRNLPSKPESNMDIWQERALADSLDTPPMEQPDFNWPTVQEESHFNESPFQQEFSWNNNQHMHDQLFNGSEDFIPEEELHHEQKEAQEVEEMQLQVDQVQQTKEEVEDMRCIAPAEAEGIVQPKKESEFEEIYTFGVGDQNQLEFLNLEQKDALSSALKDSGITDTDLSSFNMDTSIFDDSFLSATGVGTTETFVTDAHSASATIADLLNVGDSAAQDDDPDWMPEEELLAPTTSRTRQPTNARKSTIHSVKRTSMKKKPGRPEREGPYQIPTIPSRNVMNTMSEEEIQGLKYRRMRELNNQASKACRAKRKNKQQSLEEELVVEQGKNLRLRQKLETMEKNYDQYKKLAASAKIF